jgi:predicted Zn finger-like uncharacterized protein
MEVICPKCKTTYDFEDTLIGAKGTVVRCTQCGYMFKIFRPDSPSTLDVAGWMVRKKKGPIFNIDRFSTLQRWILEGKVTAQDELSRTGKTWKKIGDIVELSGLFKMSHLEAAQGIIQKEDEPTGKIDLAGVPIKRAQMEPRASVTPQHEEAWDEIAAHSETLPYREPSPEFQHPEPGTVKGALARALEPEKELEEGESILKPVYQPNRGKKIALIVVLLVLFVPLAYLGFYYRSKFAEWMGMLKEPKSEGAAADETLKKARQLIFEDTESSFEEAEKLLKSLIDKDPKKVEAITALSEIYAARAQVLRDGIDYPMLQPGAPEDPAILQSRFMSLVIRARDYAREAVKLKPDGYEAQRAMADALRLSGEFQEAAKAINKALDAKPNDARSIYIQALVDYDQDKDMEGAVMGFNRALRKDESLLPAVFHLALMLDLQGKTDEARKELDKIIRKKEDHELAARLMGLLGKGPLVAAAAADAAVEGDVHGDVPRAGTELPAAGLGKKAPGGEEIIYPSGPASAPGGKSFDFYLSQGAKLQNGDNCAKAIEYFKKALEISPASPPAWTSLGDCYSDMGNRGEAVNAYRKALNYNSRYGPAIIAIADISKQQGKLKLALEYYKKYLEIFQSGPQANLAKRNVSEIEDLLKAKGESTEGGGGEKPPVEPDTGTKTEPKETPTEGGGPAVIKTTEEEVKSSIGQPTKDKPKTGLDPYP